MADIGQNRKQKLEKKLNKHASKLFKREKIVISKEPTSILCVCNGGLDNGVTQEEISHLFGFHGTNCEVIMLPQKSYCFVCLPSLSEAEHLYGELNGYVLTVSERRKTEVILYIFYVSEAPCSVSPTNEKPQGLILIEDFIKEEYADEIMNSIKWDESVETAQTKELKHRRVKHYGYEFKYSINNVDPDEPLLEGIPDVYKPLLDKLIESGHVKHYPDQLTINQYQPGQGIPPHIDTPSAFEDGLVALSLGSQVLMEFRHKDGRHLSVLLPDRSILIMTGESRYNWTHGITPRKSDIVPSPDGGLTLAQRGVRTSFTFRKITGVKPDQLSDYPSLPNTEEKATELESLHVHKVYEEIADHFSGTRHTPWPRIAEFVKKWPAGSLLADFGCGNGKYFGINKHVYEVGSDRSFNLAKICQERNYQVFVGDVLSIPLRSNMFDVCLCIAVIHHLSTKERRKKAISELLKILRTGGQALIYVWALEQELNKVHSKYLKKKVTGETSLTDECDEKSEKLSELTKNLIKKNTVILNTENGATDQLGINGDDDKGTPKLTKNQITNKRLFVNSENAKTDQVDKMEGSDNKVGKSEELDNIEPDEKDQDENAKSDKVNMGICDKGATSEEIYNSEPKGKDQHDKATDFLSTCSSSAKLEVHVNRTKFKQQDVLVPWQLKSKEKQSNTENTYHRYYHVFQKGEIEELCDSVDGCKVLTSYYDQGNWAVILEKL